VELPRLLHLARGRGRRSAVARQSGSAVASPADLIAGNGTAQAAPSAADARRVSDDILIRRASPAEIDEFKAIDDDACRLYEAAGLRLDLPADHPFMHAERACWLRCAGAGNVFVAEPFGGEAAGLLVMDRIDGAPYLEQLS